MNLLDIRAMKKPIIFLIFWAALTGSEVFAQKPVEQKPAPGGASIQSAPREARTEEKREELSKKLMQRKNELRREDHERAKERQNMDVHQKGPEVKKN